MKPIFFPEKTQFRRWLEENHEKEKELWVGYYKKSSNLPSMTWSQSVDQALCFGWIDGLLKSIDEKSYMIRFTPRRPKSNWSAVNLKKVQKLTDRGLMTPAGIKVFKRREKSKSGAYSYERKSVSLAYDLERQFQAVKPAWDFFSSTTPSYRKKTIGWVMSAKRKETRQKRLAILIKYSEKNERIPQVSWKNK